MSEIDRAAWMASDRRLALERAISMIEAMKRDPGTVDPLLGDFDQINVGLELAILAVTSVMLTCDE